MFSTKDLKFAPIPLLIFLFKLFAQYKRKNISTAIRARGAVGSWVGSFKRQCNSIYLIIKIHEQNLNFHINFLSLFMWK